MTQLIVMTGLPGTGKSSLAEALGRAIGVPVFAKDWLEAALLRSVPTNTLTPPLLGAAGYELLTTLAERQLQHGQSAILDSVASIAVVRARWRELARAYDAGWRVLACVCSDPELHRARLAARRRAIPGWPELTWADVERVASYYAPWREELLTLDMVEPLAENLAASLRYLQAPR
jgi:predicted kinase